MSFSMISLWLTAVILYKTGYQPAIAASLSMISDSKKEDKNCF
jgi:hypothetical protein